MGYFDKVVNGALSLVETIAGSRATAAFSAEAMNRARMGQIAVQRSHATAAKSIINQAIKADRIGSDFKDVATSISKALNKGDLTGTYKINGEDLGINDAINSLVWNGIDTNGAEKAFADSISKFKTEGMGQMYHKFRTSAGTLEDAAQALGRKSDEGLGIGGAISGFFGDPEFGKARAKTVATAGVAGAVGLRYLSGGDLTHDARGERDIAGIPFI